MARPTFPLIVISKDNSLDIVPDEKRFSKVATSALINPTVFADMVLFDGDNNKWSYMKTSEEFKNTFFTRILAKTFYNPILNAQIIWTKVGAYQLNELKESIRICIDKDDDIITQFEEADVIKSAIANASTFWEILKVLNKYVFAVDEVELAQERESRIK